MEKDEVTKIISGITLIFFTITEIVAILIMTLPLLVSGMIGDALPSLLSYGWPQLAILATILILMLYHRKKGWSISSLLQDRNIRFGAGMLLALRGFVDLFRYLPLLLVFVNNFFQFGNFEQTDSVKSMAFNIMTQAMAIIFVLGEIALGIYLFKYRQEKPKEDQSISNVNVDAIRNAIGIALFYLLVNDGRVVVNRIFSRFIQANSRTVFNYVAYDLPWMLAISAIIAILLIFAKKHSWSINDFLQEKVIRMTAGTLLVLNGIFDLINWLSGLLSIIALPDEVIQYPEFAMALKTEMRVVSAGLLLCQIGIGIYLLTFQKEKSKSVAELSV